MMSARIRLPNVYCNDILASTMYNYLVLSPQVHKSALDCGLDKPETNKQITQFRTSKHSMQYAQGSKSASTVVQMISVYIFRSIHMQDYLSMYTGTL